MTLFCLLLLQPLSAQMSLVPKAGINFSDVHTEHPEYKSVEVVSGFHIGADTRIGSRHFFLRPGLHYYHTRFALEEVDVPNTLADAPLRLHHIKIPMKVAYFLSGPQQAVRLSVNAGLIPTILLDVEENRFQLETDNFAAAGLGAGAGINVDLINFTFGFAFEMGITEYYDTLRARNRLFSMSLGYIF